MTATVSAAEQEHALQSNVTYRFLIRAVVLAVVVGIFMSLGNVNIGAIGQGLGYALAGVCVFLTFRVLGFVDLTVDGAFPIGGAVCAVLIVSGVPAEFAIVAAFIAGALTGLATALIDIVFKIEGLLASIIVITGAYTVALRIMKGRSNIPLLGEETLISRHSKTFRAWLVEQFGDEMRRQSTNLLEIIIFGFIVIISARHTLLVPAHGNRLGDSRKPVAGSDTWPAGGLAARCQASPGNLVYRTSLDNSIWDWNFGLMPMSLCSAVVSVRR